MNIKLSNLLSAGGHHDGARCPKCINARTCAEGMCMVLPGEECKSFEPREEAIERDGGAKPDAVS